MAGRRAKRTKSWTFRARGGGRQAFCVYRVPLTVKCSRYFRFSKICISKMATHRAKSTSIWASAFITTYMHTGYFWPLSVQDESDIFRRELVFRKRLVVEWNGAKVWPQILDYFLLTLNTWQTVKVRPWLLLDSNKQEAMGINSLLGHMPERTMLGLCLTAK